MKARLLSLFSLFALSAQAAVVDRVEGAFADRNLKVFFKVDVDDLQVGEILEVKALNSQMIVGRIAVEKIASDEAEASVLWIYSQANEVIRPGQEIVTRFQGDGGLFAAFQAGVAVTKEVSEFGGTQGAVGLQVGFRISPELSFALLIQANPLGEAKSGLRKVSGAYMAGIHWEQGGFNSGAYLGVQDLLTRPANALEFTVTDPVTGSSFRGVQVQHDDHFAWALQLGYDWRMKSITRQSRFGWAWGPYVNVVDAFADTGFAPIYNVGLNIKLLSGGI
jgi:hypothetical protein